MGFSVVRLPSPIRHGHGGDDVAKMPRPREESTPDGTLEFRINGPANFMASLLLSSCCSFNSHFFALQLEHLVHPEKFPHDPGTDRVGYGP